MNHWLGGLAPFICLLCTFTSTTPSNPRLPLPYRISVCLSRSKYDVSHGQPAVTRSKPLHMIDSHLIHLHRSVSILSVCVSVRFCVSGHMLSPRSFPRKNISLSFLCSLRNSMHCFLLHCPCSLSLALPDLCSLQFFYTRPIVPLPMLFPRKDISPPSYVRFSSSFGALPSVLLPLFFTTKIVSS